MRTIKKEIGLEEVISRIPSLLPYIDFDVYGDSALHNGTNDGTLGILHKATDGAEGSYGHVMGSFVLRAWKLKDDVNEEEITVGINNYDSIPESIVDLFVEVFTQVDEQSIRNWQSKKYLSDKEYQTLRESNFSINNGNDAASAVGNEKLYLKYEIIEDIELYSDAVMYYPSSYVNKEDSNDIINRSEYNELSLYGRNCYSPEYEYNGEIINKETYDSLDASCDKYKIMPIRYRNTYKLNEYIDVDTYRSKTYLSKINYEVLECTDGENIIRLPLKNINNDENVNNIPVIIGDKTFMPLFFMTKRVDNKFVLGYSNEVLTYEFYALALKEQIIKPGGTYSYRTMMNAYYEYNKKKVKSDYKELFIGTQKVGNEYVNIYDDEKFVNVNNRKDVIAFIDYYNLFGVGGQWKHKNTNEIISDNVYKSLNDNDKEQYEEYVDKQSFIRFIDNATGKYYVKDAVEAFNNENHNDVLVVSYGLDGDYMEIGYEDVVDSGFEDIDKIYQCSKYIKVYNFEEIPEDFVEYGYVNEDNGAEITSASFEDIENDYGASAYESTKYNLTDEDVITSEEYNSLSPKEQEDYEEIVIDDVTMYRFKTEITAEEQLKLPFYGQTEYIPYQYTDAKPKTVAEYEAMSEEEKGKYTPYTYVNINNSNDIITKSTYESAYSKGGQRDSYVIYQYVNSDYRIITANDFTNLYNSEKGDRWQEYSYVNMTKYNDVITTEEYQRLPKHGSLDYTATEFTNTINDNTITGEAYYKLPYEGKSNYSPIGFIHTDDEQNVIISKNKYSTLTNNEDYKPYKYKPLESVANIDETQYNALPKYGVKDYVVYEYYASINIGREGGDFVYEQFIITAEQYDDDNFWADENNGHVGEKYQYSVYSYAPKEIETGDIMSDYVVAFDDYDDIPYFGQCDYVKTEETIEAQPIDVERDIYIHKKTGEILSDDEYEAKADFEKADYESSSDTKKCGIRLVPEIVYLSQVNALIYRMKNMQKNHELNLTKKLPLENDVNCEYSKYLRMGGNDMIALLEWLRVKAEEEAEKYLPYGILENNITMSLTLNLTLQDNGYYTPAMNYKTKGMTVYTGETFTFVDKDGIADTYVYVDGIEDGVIREMKSLKIVGDWEENQNIKRIKDEIITNDPTNCFVKQYWDYSPFRYCENSNTEVTLTGTIDSKLQTLRMNKTYLNYLNQPEVPPSGEDWLFYYRKGAVYDISEGRDDDDEIIQLDSHNDGMNLLVYGTVLEDIKANNDDCTITFTYYTNAHLKVNETTHTEERLMSEEDFEYYNNNGYIKSYETVEDGYNVTIEYTDYTYELDKDTTYGEYHGIKHVDTYYYEQYGELYDLAANENNFNEYISSTKRGIEKYAFNATPNNSTTKIINTQVVNLPYIGSDFEFTFNIKENGSDQLYSPVYKEELLNGIHFKPTIDNNAFVLRGTNAAFERHLRMGDVKSLEDFENYHNGSFFNIQNNF